MASPATTLHHWNSDDLATWIIEAPQPTDNPCARTVLLSPEVALPAGCDEIIPSWAAQALRDTWIEVELRLRTGEHWSRSYQLAAWDAALDQGYRRSFDNQADDAASVATDTLQLRHAADAVQVRVLLCATTNTQQATLQRVALCCAVPSDANAVVAAPAVPRIVVPCYSQYAFPAGSGWCSPTALTMVLGYWATAANNPHLQQFTSAASIPGYTAPRVYDPVYEGTGNWAFNVACAGALGLQAYVTRLHSLAQVARWLAADVPLICSVSWKLGTLDDAPIEHSAGHLLVVAGLEGEHMLVADPAGATPAAVERRYRADQFFRNWQQSSQGTVYLIHPPTWDTPRPEPTDAWV